jgi:hypothetical protein
MGSIAGVEAPPTVPQTTRVQQIRVEVQQAIDALNVVLDTKIKALNDKLGDRPHILISRPRIIS